MFPPVIYPANVIEAILYIQLCRKPSHTTICTSLCYHIVSIRLYQQVPPLPANILRLRPLLAYVFSVLPTALPCHCPVTLLSIWKLHDSSGLSWLLLIGLDSLPGSLLYSFPFVFSFQMRLGGRLAVGACHLCPPSEGKTKRVPNERDLMK